ncbi:hypothetical protein [Clostridium sp.]|uniref:hypothetical protein n=1 Tax=Clostridium sp. TaxID=1506 RepID=UPI003F2B8356
MSNKYFVTVGYSIGLMPTNEGVIGIVDRGQDTVILEHKSFSVWQVACHALKENSFFEKYNQLNCEEDSETYINKFIDEGILVKVDIDEDIEYTFNLLKDFRLCRQGLGMGVNLDDVTKFNVLTSEMIDLEPLEFSIWSVANATDKISDIYNKLGGEINKAIFISRILKLYVNNLIYFMV